MGKSDHPPFFQPYAILAVLVTATALILSFLCVFAGNTPGFMEPYSIFTLNTTRLGQNAVEKIDEKIMSFNVTKIITKRDVPAAVIVDAAMITQPPQLYARQGIDDIFSDLTAGAGSIKSNAGDAIDSVQTAIESKVTSVASAVESKASSVEGIVASKISSAINSVQTSVVEAVNGTYNDWIDELDLQVSNLLPLLISSTLLIYHFAGLLLNPHADDLRRPVCHSFRSEHHHWRKCHPAKRDPQARRLLLVPFRLEPPRLDRNPLRNLHLLHVPHPARSNLDDYPLYSQKGPPQYHHLRRSLGVHRIGNDPYARSRGRSFQAPKSSWKWNWFED